MAATELRGKVRWLITIRAIISTILLGSAIVAQITAPGSLPIDPLFFLIGLTFTLTIVYALTLRLVERWRWLVDLQLGGDALIVSAFILATGGITSYFASLYVLPIVAGSTVQFRRGGLMVAPLSGSLAESVRSAGAQLEQASTEIADLQAFNAHVIDSLPSGLVTTDRQQRVLTFNRAAEAITGLSFGAVVGRPLIEVLQMP